MRRPLTFLAAAAGLLLLFVRCGGTSEGRRNVILIVTDTVRADKLGCYGNDRDLTPSLDTFAAEGVRFAQASSHAPWTLPSIATMLTGLHPAEHGAGGRLGRFRPLAESVTSLPATFSAAGYDTHCIANVGFLQEQFQVTRDFAGADVVAPASNVEMRDARRTTDAALAWIDAHREQPFFLLLHYFDPHAVYNPPQPFRRRFALEADRQDATWQFPKRAQMIAIRGGNLPSADLLVRAEALHDAEIAYMDDQLGRLFIGLSQRGLDPTTAVAITSDHGEEFLEHGGFEHGHQLYQELTHVPLLLRWPGVEPGVVDRVVGHVDLAATLCQLAGVAPDEQFVQFGRSLIDPDAPPRAILAHGNMWSEPLTSYRVGDEKLIRRGDGTHELYDLSTDGGEQADLATARPVRVRELAALLDEVQRYMHAVASGEPVELSPEMQAHFASQGYSGGDE
jgi:choline-sulfatase